MSSKLESDVCCRLQVAPPGERHGGNRRPGRKQRHRLLLSTWRDSLHVTCGLTACTPGSAPGPTLGNEYGKTLPFTKLYLPVGGDPGRISQRSLASENWSPCGIVWCCLCYPTFCRFSRTPTCDRHGHRQDTDGHRPMA